MNRNELTTKTSYPVAEILARNTKPFSDVEIIEDWINGVQDSFKTIETETVTEVRSLQLSDSACDRRVDIF